MFNVHSALDNFELFKNAKCHSSCNADRERQNQLRNFVPVDLEQLTKKSLSHLEV